MKRENTKNIKKPLKLFDDRAKRTILKIIDCVLAGAMLVFALRIMMSNDEQSLLEAFICLLFTAVVSKFFAAFALSRHEKLLFWRDLSTGAALLAAAIILLVLQYQVIAYQITMAVYFLSLLTGRIIAIIRRSSKRSVIVNVLMSLLLVYLFIDTFFISGATEQNAEAFLFVIFPIIAGGGALVHIIAVSFLEMRLKVMLKIIRKTYATEILFGLLILIIAFSFVFQSLEASIETYADAVWYCFSVVTTIGFGDITVVSLLSRVLSIILGIYGLIVVAVITSIIVNFYNEVKDGKDEENTENEPADKTANGLLEAEETKNDEQQD